jgi:hypothetical protein
MVLIQALFQVKNLAPRSIVLVTPGRRVVLIATDDKLLSAVLALPVVVPVMVLVKVLAPAKVWVPVVTSPGNDALAG